MNYVNFFLENKDPTTAYILCLKNKEDRRRVIEEKYSLNYNLIAPYLTPEKLKNILPQITDITFLLSDCVRKNNWKLYKDVLSLTKVTCNFNIVMEALGESGNIEKIKECVQKNYKDKSRYSNAVWNRILLGAARRDQKDACDLAIKNGASNLYMAAREAMKYGHENIANTIFPHMSVDDIVYMKARKGEITEDTIPALLGGIQGDRKNVIEYFEKNYPEYFSDSSVSEALVETGNITLLLKYSTEKSVPGIVKSSIEKGYVGLIEYYFNRVQNIDDYDFHVSYYQGRYGYTLLKIVNEFAYFLGCIAGNNYESQDYILYHNPRYEVYTFDILVQSIISEVLSNVILEFEEKKYTEKQIEKLLNVSIYFRNLEITNFLYEKFDNYDFILYNSLEKSAMNIFFYFKENYPQKFAKINFQRFLENAIISENMPFVAFLIDHFKIDIKEAFSFAVKFGSTDMVEWLYSKYNIEPSQKNIDDAVNEGNWEVVKLFSKIGNYDRLKKIYQKFYPRLSDREIVYKIENDKQNRTFNSRGPEWYVKGGMAYKKKYS